VAESLGSAVLSISVDDSRLKAGLQAAERQARSTGQAVGQAFTATNKPILTAANGLQYFVDAQGRARDATGKFLTVAQQQAAGLDRIGVAAQGTGLRLGEFATKAGIALAVLETARRIAFFTTDQITQLDSASAAVETLGVDSQELKSRLRALSVELDSNISQIDLTKAAYDVASSGFSSAADATQILRAAAIGAKGGFAEVNDVASALTGVLNAYGLSAASASKIVDGFVQTQADGVITVRQYAAEIGNIASIAAASGVGIEELNAAIATATLRGVPVAQTFTGLRQALASIIKPSEQAKELAQSLGIEFNVNALQAKGFGGVLTDIQQKTGGAADKIAVLLGSVEAQAAVQPLLNDQLVKYNELLGRQADASGEAAKAAGTNAKTISSGLQQIGNGFSNLATTLDSKLTPLLGGFIAQLNNVLAKLNQVSALTPEQVKRRDTEAANIVQQAIGPLGGSGFFGAVTVKYKGKTYKGSATGVKEAILQDLLKEELAKVNEATGANSTATAAPASASAPSVAAEGAKEDAKRLAIQKLGLLELQVLKSRTAAANQLATAEGTALLVLQNKLGIEERVAQAKAAQLKLQEELAKPAGDGKDGTRSSQRVDELLIAQQKANAEVRQAYAEAGASLVKNAKTAADALKSARDSYNSLVRSNLDFLTPGFARSQIAQARAAIQPLVDRGVIRQGIDISSPDRLFELANFAESFTKAERDLGQAIDENTRAQKELLNKDWKVTVNVPGGSASGDVVGAVNSRL